MAVAFGLPKLGPARALVFLLHLDCVANLLDFENDELIVHVSVGVALCKNLVSLLHLALGDQPSGRLRYGPDENELEDGWESHDKGRSSP